LQVQARLSGAELGTAIHTECVLHLLLLYTSFSPVLESAFLPSLFFSEEDLLLLKYCVQTGTALARKVSFFGSGNKNLSGKSCQVSRVIVFCMRLNICLYYLK
jgi:hypothetical protein